MWASYFEEAQIVGVDIDPSADLEYGDRITAVIGDQTRRSVLDKALKLLPSVDIIIDDGAHINNLTVATFEYLWPRLRPGGIYVIEDTVCVGELRLGNTRAQTEQLVLTLLRGLEVNGRIMAKGNAADFYKINSDYVLNEYERWVESVELYRGVYVIRKRPK
nr:class I SAM-dependent methyltransferase [Sinorhizobium meliloti]